MFSLQRTQPTLIPVVALIVMMLTSLWADASLRIPHGHVMARGVVLDESTQQPTLVEYNTYGC